MASSGFVVAVVVAVAVASLGGAARAAECPEAQTYSALMASPWEGGALVGFCQDLFPDNTTIRLSPDVGCEGELGNTTFLIRSMGTFSARCRASLALFQCYLMLPLGDSLLPTLPCTQDQKDQVGNATTLLQWIVGECGDEADPLFANGFDEAFNQLDANFQVFPILTQFCRVVDALPPLDPARWIPDRWQCPEGMVKKDRADLQDLSSSEIGCGFPCPGPLLTESEYDAVKFVLDVPNTVCCCINIVSLIALLVIKGKSLRFPATIFVHFMFAAIGFQLTLCFGLFRGSHEGIWCHNAYTPADQSDTVCAVQAVFVMYWGKLALNWWLCIVVNLWTMVSRPFERKSYEMYYTVYSYLHPAFFVACVLGLDLVEYVPGSPWCFLTRRRGSLYQYVFFYADMYLILITGAVLLFKTLYLFRTHSFSAQATGRMKTMISYKMGFLLAYAWLLFSVSCFLHFDGVEIRRDAITRNVRGYVTCLFEEYIANDTPDYGRCTLDERVNAGLLLTSLLLISGLGLVQSVLFGAASPALSGISQRFAADQNKRDSAKAAAPMSPAGFHGAKGGKGGQEEKGVGDWVWGEPQRGPGTTAEVPD